jgi:hypothetical protein
MMRPATVGSALATRGRGAAEAVTEQEDAFGRQLRHRRVGPADPPTGAPPR